MEKSNLVAEYTEKLLENLRNLSKKNKEINNKL